jgi:sulfur-oxidizing protein SoxY
MQDTRTRREALKAGGAVTVYALAVAAGLIRPGQSLAQAAGNWNKAAFESKAMADAQKAMGVASMTESAEVRFANPTPDIAENGAVVPITIASGVPKTESISILVAKNPNVLIGTFDIANGTDPFVSTRVKMGETSDVYALVKADGRYYYAKKEIKVTIGGCGG